MATKKATSSAETQVSTTEPIEAKTDTAVNEGSPHEAAEPERQATPQAEIVEAENQGTPSTPEVEFPRLFRVKNQTRMPVRLVVAPVDLGPAPATCEVLIRSWDQYHKMLNDLEALRVLNNLPLDAFGVEPVAEGGGA